MKKFEYYEVTSSFDDLVVNFENLEDAKLFCQSTNDYSISHRKIFVLCESYYEAFEFKKEVERQKVLAKLTPKERQILGLE